MFFTNRMKIFQRLPWKNNFLLQYYWPWIMLLAKCSRVKSFSFCCMLEATKFILQGQNSIDWSPCREQAPKHSTFAPSSWSNKLTVRSVILYRNMREIFSVFSKMILILSRTNSIQNKLTRVYFQQKYFYELLYAWDTTFKRLQQLYFCYNVMRCPLSPRFSLFHFILFFRETKTLDYY